MAIKQENDHCEAQITGAVISYAGLQQTNNYPHYQLIFTLFSCLINEIVQPIKIVTQVVKNAQLNSTYSKITSS